jgi:hypothetical protein
VRGAILFVKLTINLGIVELRVSEMVPFGTRLTSPFVLSVARCREQRFHSPIAKQLILDSD